MSETIDSVKTAATAAFQDGFAKWQSSLGDATAHGKANLDAFVVSSQTMAKGLEDVAAIAAAYSKAALEKSTEAFKALSSAKSLQEAVEVQADYAKGSLETWLAEYNKISDVMLTTAKEAVKPLSERTSAMVEAVQAAK